MKKNLFLKGFMLLILLFSVSIEAQMTIGGKKEPEAFSVLELLNKGGLRLPQMTTTERNAFAVQGNDKGEGLTIYNKTTGCVEYWNKIRWVSMCEGTSQTTIAPIPCVSIAADGTGCDSTFNITDPDCPNGPFTISIVAGGNYAYLTDLDEVNGSFKIAFTPNETVNIHTVLVRVTSTCTSLFKEFLFSQKGVDCSSMTYSVPSISPSSAALSLCSGGSVYLSVPANTANLDKLIWTRNGVEVARGVSYYIATQKGKYNVSMGAVGCNTSAANERNVTESGSAAPANITILASNNGVMCGTNSVTLSAVGTVTGTIAWLHNGVEERTGATVTLSGDSNLGEWFAAVKDAGCYSKQSNSITITKSQATGQVNVPAADVLVNGVPLNTFTAFCAGGTLDLSIANKINGLTYTWYNGNDQITTNPFIVPSNQTTMSLRMVATDNSGALCPAESHVMERNITSGSTPAQPNITGNATLCDGTTDLTLVPAVAGTYTYTWYKDGVKMAETTPTITVSTPGVTYSGSVTNTTGCTSTLAVKTIAVNVSSIPVLSWNPTPAATATFGAKLTVQTDLQFGPANSYTWTANNGATITGTGSSVTVNLPASGTDGTQIKITVTAKNNCGNSNTKEHVITLNNACPTPSLSAQADLSQSVTAGSGAIVKVSITDGVTPTYQWYSNTSATTTGSPTLISGATSATYTYTPAVAGTYYLFCIAKNSCLGNPTATSPVFSITAQVDPATILTGAGTLSGKTCFDIAESNDNTNCGPLASRLSTKADFNQPAVNTQTYTFTASGTISKVRFVYVESLSGAIVQSLTPAVDKSQTLNVTGTLTATLVYKSSLSSNGGILGTAVGKDANSALTVDIYVVYNDNAAGTGQDKTVKLTAQIKDCACCGAKISATVWKAFLCHNLGADTSLNPFTPAQGLVGSYYKQGSSVPGGAYVKNGWGSTGIKTANDPCPAGYRVPTTAEWQGVIANNLPVEYKGSKTGNGNGGTMIGANLFLPGGGYYLDNTTFYSEGATILWSANDNHTFIAGTTNGPSNLGMSTNWAGDLNRYTSNVRCISIN